MNAIDSIKYTINLTDMTVGMYLGDLTQDEMMVRRKLGKPPLF